ncbi:hypothetical protein HOG16_01280 [Candidatus Woesearchaeota archaeon]|jgi:hypothetical protein|nr:hypothetical protein [Candidatus Woesearchaeota archaeon]MBT4321762.1 hypothetical protein [Candidatus Woesearchaeota archaeon]
MKKRGQELSTNTIIVVILAVLVLIIVAIFFTGGFETFKDKIQGIWQKGALPVQEVVVECNGYCSSYDTTGLEKFKTNFCTIDYELDTTGDGKVDEYARCQDLVTCGAVESAGGCLS